MASCLDNNKAMGVLVEFKPEEENGVLVPISWSSELLIKTSGRITSSWKMYDTCLSFTLSKDQAAYIRRMDVVMEPLAKETGGPSKKGWFPLSERLAGWRAETRQRFKNEKIETFYHHDKLKRILRSMDQVKFYIYYGFVPTCQERKRSREAQHYSLVINVSVVESSSSDLLQSQWKRERKNDVISASSTQSSGEVVSKVGASSSSSSSCYKKPLEKALEAFYADAHNNLLNYQEN